VLTGFAAEAERGDSSKVGSAVRDSLEVGLAGGDSSEVGSTGGNSLEMGLTDSVEVEGISGKRSGRGSS
jgi:hypothetical protein